VFSLSCVQGGFVAEGVDSGSTFLEVNLTEKVMNRHLSHQKERRQKYMD